MNNVPTDLLARNAEWFVAAGQMPAEPTPSVRQTAFYLGMQMEETAEKMEAIFGSTMTVIAQMHATANALKEGALDGMVEEAMKNPAVVKKMLDGDIDNLWVTVGAIKAQGADGPGAYGEVNRANWEKRWPDGTFHLHPVTNKVLKPAGWREPELTPFIHPSLRGEA